MAKVVIKGARLSSNPETKVVGHDQGLAGKVNSTQNGKLFYVAECIVMAGMNAVKKSATIWADDNGRFALSVDEYNKLFAGETTNGELVTFDDVPSYQVENSNGEMKTYTHVKLLVLDGEKDIDVLNAWAKRQANQTAQASGPTAITSKATGPTAPKATA